MKKNLILDKFGGFTLIEILVVTTIISLLGTVGYVSFSTTIKNSRDTKRKADLETIKIGLSVYYQAKQVYPVHVAFDGSAVIDDNNVKYIDKTPQDPLVASGYKYYYQTTSDAFIVCALLENGTETNGVDGTKCKSDGTKCNYCTSVTGNYLAQNNTTTTASQLLNCTQKCEGKCAGDDSCGGTCSDNCTNPSVCYLSTCCTPNCTGKCGGATDGCGNLCSFSCARGYSCVNQSCSVIIPVGGIVFIASSIVPTGFLECNGQSTSGYTELQNIVGNNVPDLRGQFIRGWDNGRGIDPDAGRIIGSTQQDELISHTHLAYYHSWYAGSQGNQTSVMWRTGTMDGSQTTSATGGTETRPKNVALMAIIKY